MVVWTYYSNSQYSVIVSLHKSVFPINQKEVSLRDAMWNTIASFAFHKVLIHFYFHVAFPVTGAEFEKVDRTRIMQNIPYLWQLDSPTHSI